MSSEQEAPRFVIGVPKETIAGERRVAATPATVVALRKLGLEVLVQSGAGELSSIQDAAYAEAGAQVVQDVAQVWAADLVIKVRAPTSLAEGGHEVELLRDGGRLLSFVWPAQNAELLGRLTAKKATVLAMDMVPRISRAQKLDALSAMANIAGYRAVIEATHQLGRFLGAQMTAAGKVKPAQVLVIGAGVAGLSAAATARSLGAQVSAFDTRPAVREQVESLGGKFIPFEPPESGEGDGGYAKEVSEAYLAAEQALIAQHCATADIVITTALVPGMRAPILIPSGAVVGMRRGSVIVDLAAEQGGNCALTERDRTVERFGVWVFGHTDLTSRMGPVASELYATTVLRVIEEIYVDKRLTIDREDEIHRSMLVVDAGTVTWPPPKFAPRAAAPAPVPAAAPIAHVPPPASNVGNVVMGAAALTVLGLSSFGTPELRQHITTFVLACIVGWHVIWNVTPALHTPLMSVTNAISGIILVGGMLAVVGGGLGPATWLGVAAVLVASINVAGGFLVTQRMLRMFRRA